MTLKQKTLVSQLLVGVLDILSFGVVVNNCLCNLNMLNSEASLYTSVTMHTLCASFSRLCRL